MPIITYKDLPNIRKENEGKRIVFCSGSFDLLHVGHLKFLEASRAQGDILVVAVGNDEDIKTAKGPQRPIIGEYDRIRLVNALKCVDYAFINNSPKPGEAWLMPIQEIFSIMKPDVWVVNYETSHLNERKVIAEKNNVELLVLNLERTGAVEDGTSSTTSIVEKMRAQK